MQIGEQRRLSFTYVNSKRANRAVVGSGSVCRQEEKERGGVWQGGGGGEGMEINKQMETKIENRGIALK